MDPSLQQKRMSSTGLIDEGDTDSRGTENRILDEDPPPPASEEGEEDPQAALKYGAQSLVSLIIPVTICMAVVVANILSVTSFTENTNTYFYYTPFHETGNISSGTRFGQAILNTLIVVGIFTVMTFLLVLLYKYRCYKVLHGYLIFASLSLLTLFTAFYLERVIKQYNVYFDWVTASFVLLNFAVMGMMAIFWKSPLIIQQIYLLCTCTLLSLIFIQYLPHWTTWVLLAGMAIYDLAAVLTKYGPLKILVDIVKERDEAFLPSLIYSSTMMWTVGMAERDGTSGPGTYQTSPSAEEEEQAQPGVHAPNGEQADEEEEQGVKLGLGDFIFYSILVGRATADSGGDWNVILACVLAILVGLSLTLLLLAIFQHALPALPISIMLGLIFYFSTKALVTPFTNALSAEQVFL